MSEDFDTLAVLDSICDLYKVDVGQIYTTFRSNAKNGKNLHPRFSYLPLAKKIFDPIDKKQVPDLYISLFDKCEEYCRTNGIVTIGVPREPSSMISLRDLILNIIIPYQLPSSQKAPQKDTSASGPDAKKKKRARFITVPPRVCIPFEKVKELCRRVLSIPVPIESKLWKQVRFILVPDNKKEKLKQLAPIVAEAARNGTISFGALSFCMHSEYLNEELPPESILHALYLGPLKSGTVEFFASGRSTEFRQKCRESIELADKMRGDANAHSANRPANISPNNPEICSLRDFSYNTMVLINELKGLKKGFSAIPNGWACAAVKKFGKRTYEDKTWREENMYDLIWTVMVQRPNLKKFLCETLERDFHDYGAAKYWKRMQPSQMDRIFIRNRNETQIDPLADSEEYLNFPPTVQSVSFVNTSSELKSVTELINKEVDEKGEAIVGLDAEWSAFTGDSKATILQVAVGAFVFIVDMESAALPKDDLRTFFVHLFLNKKIVKLGFQFSEDLLQMRNAVEHCRALYQPENVLCVGKMIADLLDLTEKRDDCVDILSQVVPFMKTSDLDDTLDSVAEDEKNGEAPSDASVQAACPSTSKESSNGENNESLAQKTVNKGLSYLCEQILGRPLDKTEQCSVWDRRPLRPLQLRYAAMDAYCCLMLYDVCCKWANRLDLSIDDITKNQSPIRVSMPLFSDDF